MSELILYIIIAIIWAIISLISRAAQNEKKNSKNIKNAKNEEKYQRKEFEDEEEIFRKLNKNLNDLTDINKTNTDNSNKNNNKEVNKPIYESNKVYETSFKDKEILELQKKYDSIMSGKNNINNMKENISKENISRVDFPTKKAGDINNMLSSLDIKNAIIYNAILEPKRINYRFRNIKKS